MNRPLSVHIILTGMMGSGKSTVGSQLARKMSVPFYDMDQIIELESGMTVRQFFDTFGETAFRHAEHRVLQEIMSNKNFGVIATGGGTVLSSENRRIMRNHGLIVWLYCRPSILINRLLNSTTNRPILNQRNWQEHLIELYRSRYAAYVQSHFQVRNEEDSLHAIREIMDRCDL